MKLSAFFLSELDLPILQVPYYPAWLDSVPYARQPTVATHLRNAGKFFKLYIFITIKNNGFLYTSASVQKKTADQKTVVNIPV
jgi:hypothetical protein